MIPAPEKTSWRQYLPFLAWLPNVSRSDVRFDFMAGLTGAIVVLPQGVAFATIAGMPPQYGLYAGMIPAIVAAFLGSSRMLVSGPTTAASIVLFSALSAYAEPGSIDYVSMALTLTFMVGVLEIALGLARMGALVNFISHSVIIGFTAGAAILIGAKQLKNFFGIDMARGGHLHDILIQFAGQVTDINPWVTLVAFTTLASGILARRYLPRLPYLIVAMVVGSLLAALLNWLLGGEEATGIATVGALPQSLPPLSAPDFSLDTIKHLAPSALAVTLFALTEAVSIGRSLAARTGDRVDGNQEFIGQGLSNIAGSFFSGYVATGSFNRSALNFQSGARTPLAAAFAGLLLMVIVLLVAPLAAYLPNAGMAGILFLVAWGLLDFKEIRHILSSSRRETAIMMVTFLSALFLELEVAIFAGILLSLVLYLERVSHPRVISPVPDPGADKRALSDRGHLPRCPQLRLLRIDGSLFFGSVNYIEDVFDRLHDSYPEQKHLAIICEGINFADISGGATLVKESRRRQKEGGALYLVHVKKGLWNSLDKDGSLDTIGPEHVFGSKRAAIHGIYQRLDKERCRNCDNRIFEECQEEFGPAPSANRQG